MNKKDFGCKMVTVELPSGKMFEFFNMTRELEINFRKFRVVSVRDLTEKEAKEIGSQINR